MQGVDLSKIRGGRQGQQRVAQAVAMESANRVLTRRALDVLKSIAVGEYVPPEERQKEAEPATEEEAAPAEERVSSEESTPGEEADEVETVVGDTSIDIGNTSIEAESKPE